ncbi:MAG: ATP-binding protein [Candidatus Cryptobacteroides sp.]
MITRTQESTIKALLGSNKAIILIGARQVGKSTLLHSILDGDKTVLWLNGDDDDVREMFENISSTRLKAIIGDKNTVVLDEAQRIENIGLRIKLITDQIPGVQVIATGSSSFELSSKVNEPLTGRKRELKLFPLSFNEMVSHTSFLEEQRMIPHRMIYGYYPEVVCSPANEKVVLKELTDSYLYRDILSFDTLRKPDVIVRLLKALALQIGSQVSYNELASLLGLTSKTVEKYLDILEKSYIIFRLGSFSRNMRNELKMSRKIYFWDLGIRNVLIGNMSSLENRNDVGALWENFLIAERMKNSNYSNSFAQSYFWRTKDQSEIDYLEEEDGKLNAYEFKWNPAKSKAKCPASFAAAYPYSSYKVITPDNIEEFFTPDPAL